MASPVNKLSEYGNTFQHKVIASLISDREFMLRSVPIMKPEYFGSDSMQWITEFTADYITKFKKPPTMETYAYETKKIGAQGNKLRDSIVSDLKEIFITTKAPDLEYVKEQFLDFARNQTWKKAILDSVPHLESGNYDRIKVLIDEAQRAGISKNIGSVWKETFESRITDSNRLPVELPWDIINEVTGGGLGSGELGVAMGPSGAGKSWFLVSIAAHMLRKNKNVIYYTLELSEDYVNLRFDAHFTGYASQDIRYNAEEVNKKINKVPGNLLVKNYPTKMASVADLIANTYTAISMGFEPHAIVVDYGDLLRAEMKYGSVEKRFELEFIFEQLRGMAGEFQLPVWTATQTNRSSVSDDYIAADRVSEAYSKIAISDFIVSISRKDDDKVMNTGRVYVAKNRFGPDGLKFPAKINLAIGHIQVFEESTERGEQTKKEMKDGPKNEMLKSFAEFKKRGNTPNGDKKVEGMG